MAKRKQQHTDGVISHAPDATPEELTALQQIAFVPGDESLDLTKAEKLRTTALMMAIQYVEKTIVNDAQMFQALKADGRTLLAATVPYVVQSAVDFEMFLLGRFSHREPTKAMATESPAETKESAAVDPPVDSTGTLSTRDRS